MIVVSQTKLARNVFERTSPLFVSIRWCKRSHYSSLSVRFDSSIPVLTYYDHCIATYWRHGELLFVPENYFLTNELFDQIKDGKPSWNGVKIVDNSCEGGGLDLENSVVWVNALSLHLEDFSFNKMNF